MTFVDVINDKAGKEKNLKNWLHHGVLVTTQESQNPDQAINEFNTFKHKSGIKFSFTLISQVENRDNLASLSTEMEGGHYAVRVGSNISRAFDTALSRDRKR